MRTISDTSVKALKTQGSYCSGLHVRSSSHIGSGRRDELLVHSVDLFVLDRDQVKEVVRAA